MVINYDVPGEKDSYVHRIGRTGRAGKGGLAITFVTSDDIMSLYEIEEHIGAMISEAEIPSEAVLKENITEVDTWKQANALKVVPQDASVSKPQRSRPYRDTSVPSPQKSSLPGPLQYLIHKVTCQGGMLPRRIHRITGQEGMPAS